jgi:hypothetical protein
MIKTHDRNHPLPPSVPEFYAIIRVQDRGPYTKDAKLARQLNLETVLAKANFSDPSTSISPKFNYTFMAVVDIIAEANEPLQWLAVKPDHKHLSLSHKQIDLLLDVLETTLMGPGPGLHQITPLVRRAMDTLKLEIAALRQDVQDQR